MRPLATTARRARAVSSTLVAALALSALGACGDAETAPSSGADGDEVTTVEIAFEGDTVTPNGERLEVEAGSPVELVVTADTEGEIHVHATPEQELAYGAGTTTLPLTLDQPGLVDVESHSLEQIIVQLEVK